MRNPALLQPAKRFLYSFFAVAALSCLALAEVEMHPEVLEVIEDAPELIEQIVVAPEKGIMSSPWFLGGLVFAITFVIEEVAIAASAYFIGSDRIGHAWGLLSLYAGIFFSDLFLYALGTLIRRNRWVRGYIDVNYYQTQVQRWLSRGLWTAVTVARIVPGMLIPVFLMLGFSRADLRKVSFVNLIVTGLYTVAALYLLLYMGLQVSDLINEEVGFSLAVLLVLYVYRKKLWDFFQVRFHLLRSPKAASWPAESHFGMPALQAPRRLTFFEWLPSPVSYVPVYLGYIFYALRFRSLSAPTAANPGIEMSGICGESKSKILSSFPPSVERFLPRWTVLVVRSSLTVDDAEKQLTEARLTYPVIAKPDIGYMSRGVELISDRNGLQDYLERFPDEQSILLQEFLTEAGEAGVFYWCHPDDPSRYEVTLALTYFPFVIGDGVSPVKQLVRKDPRFAYFQRNFELENENVPAAGATVRLKISGSTKDGSVHTFFPLTGESPLARTIHEISRSLPEFWIGRYDVKYADIASLLSGEFKILELNGAAGEDLTAWDPGYDALHCYRTLLRQLRKLFEIGLANKKRGFSPVRGPDLLKAYIEQESLLFRLASATYRKRAQAKENLRDKK